MEYSFFDRYSLAFRLPFLAVSLVVCLAAGALAYHDGVFSAIPFLLAIVAVLLSHVATNLANDYYDFKAGNFPKKKKGPTGGSFAIQTGLFRETQIAGMASVCFLVSIAIFAWLSLKTSPLLFLLGLAGNFIGFFYTAPPLKFGYRQFGELITFIGMGPLLFATVYFAQAGTVTAAGLALSAFLGLMVSNILLAAQLPDINEDKKSRKWTFTSVNGEQAASKLFLASGLLGALFLVAGVYWFGLPPLALGGLVGTILTYRAYSKMAKGDYIAGVTGALYALEAGGLLVALCVLF